MTAYPIPYTNVTAGADKRISADRIKANFDAILPTKTPANAGDTGTAGEMCKDANYIYVCTATNTWKRVSISTW